MTEWLGDGLMCHQPGADFFFSIFGTRELIHSKYGLTA